MIPVIADNADYLEGFGDFSGKNAKKHPELIIDFLKEYKSGNYLFTTLRYKHRYPACWRCKSELVWKVADEWYIAMDRTPQNATTGKSKQTLRERMIEVAKKIKWIPEFGLDRELDWLKNMHDWLISKKNRYWGLALPIYECKKCNSFEVIGGFDELKERAVSGWDQFEGKTPHKPYIDEVKIKCKKCDSEIARIDDVGNPWLDAGIIPFSTLIDPETKKLSYITDKKYFKEWFPANFITESFPGQFKNWFYSLIAMSSILENTNPFETILGYASVVGEDGRAMHKSWGNSIEFNEAADKIGVDVMRWMYARQSPTDNLPFGYKKADEVRRQLYLILWNSFKFVVDYANQDGVRSEVLGVRSEASNILDEWMMERLAFVGKNVKKYLSDFNARSATEEIESLVNDFSTWYIRRSRDRVGANSEDEKDKQSFYSTALRVLENLSIILSPFMPFITEEIYTHLKDGESVYLTHWPELKANNNEIIEDMKLVREIVEVGHRVRKENNLKVRQPLAEVKVTLPKNRIFKLSKRENELFELIKSELNVKKVTTANDGEEIKVEYDTNITPELELEGELRDMLRKIQQERKEKNISINDSINLTVPEKFQKYEELIKKKVNAKTVTYGNDLLVE